MLWWRRFGNYAQALEAACTPNGWMQFDPHQWADTPVVRLVCFEPKEADMTTTSRTSLRAMSRRTILVQSAGCAAGAAGLLLPLKEAVAKMSQKSVAYQDSPKDDQKC